MAVFQALVVIIWLDVVVGNSAGNDVFAMLVWMVAMLVEPLRLFHPTVLAPAVGNAVCRENIPNMPYM